MTMDIKDIIKWFIPCFHILLNEKLDKKWIFVCLLLFLNLAACSRINSELVLSKNLDSTKKLNLSSVKYDESETSNQSAGYTEEILQVKEPRTLIDTSVGRTFGRPFMKKMMAGLIPIIFQVGAASTWAVVAALVAVKTLLVTLLILKLLLLAGAAKIGAFFGSKGHQHWEPPHPPQKEIHLHIHNSGHEQHDEHIPISTWSRDGYTTADSKQVYVADSKPVYAVDPYRAGPQTISTPYGNYVKIDSSPLLGHGIVTT